jgi:hypothetical protein
MATNNPFYIHLNGAGTVEDLRDIFYSRSGANVWMLQIIPSHVEAKTPLNCPLVSDVPIEWSHDNKDILVIYKAMHKRFNVVVVILFEFLHKNDAYQIYDNLHSTLSDHRIGNCHTSTAGKPNKGQTKCPCQEDPELIKR